jgi:hypothetical protein
VFFCRKRSFALRFLSVNSNNRFDAAYESATSGKEASCHTQLSIGAIEVPIRSHRTDFRILFDKKIFLDRTEPTKDPSEYIFVITTANFLTEFFRPSL